MKPELEKAARYAVDVLFGLWLVGLSIFFLLRFSFVFYNANAEAIKGFFGG